MSNEYNHTTIMDENGAVAIVGIGCRFPGCTNIEEFWNLLYHGENKVREIPPERFNTEAFFAPNFEEPGKTYAKWGGLVDNPLEWDNTVFGINEMEATVMDPQQRFVLEVTYKALENAGFPLEKVKGSNTAVYMCQMNEDYARHLGTDFSAWRNYEFTGSNAAILSNRISYTFDFRGPSVTVDTACSGAMVSVHMGTHSILSGESDMAVCGGSNYILGPTTFIALSKSRMASTTGQCRAFSDNPDGYVKGEGSGVVILKRLDKALADKDRIWGILKTSICSDGRAETPITSPSKHQLKALITDVVQKAKINPADIQYVECHGTGTPSGDPCEAWGVGNVYGVATKKQGRPPVPIGSVKTNIGHPESSAGTAGLIKVLLQLYHGTIVPSLHSEKLNHNIDFKGMNITVPQKVCPIGYIDGEKKRRLMGVNSNGFGGTAVHGIVQMEEDLARPLIPETNGVNYLPVIFSALSEQGLRDTLQDTLKGIEEKKVPSFLQLSNTSTLKRTHYNVRYILFAKSLEETKEILEATLQSKDRIGKKSDDKGNNIIFPFCGMGSHWINMGLVLYQENTTFKETIDRIQFELDKYPLKISLLDCFKGINDLTDPLYGQPAIFGVQVGLFEILRSKGIKPKVILGHSVGEVAASYASGCLCFEQAVKVIYERGRVLHGIQGGSMLVVGKLKVVHVEHLIKETGLNIDIAAHNSASSCTLSGDTGDIKKMKEEIESKFGEGLFLRLLDVKVAYHSKYMDPVLKELGEKLDDLDPDETNTLIRLISTVTGEEINQKQCCSSTYWKNNLRRGVKFNAAFSKALTDADHNIIVEIGPKPVLRSYIKEIASEKNYTLMATMIEKGTSKQINQVITQFFLSGGNINWDTYYNTFCPVGTYPRYIYQRKYMYFEPETSIAWRSGLCSQTEIYGGKRATVHPFVNLDKNTPDGLIRYTAKLTATNTPFVFEHKLDDLILAPGGTYPELGLAALSNHLKESLLPGRDNIFLDVKFNRPITVPEGQKEREASIILFDCDDPKREASHYQYDVATDEVLHATGYISVNQRDLRSNLEMLDLKSIRRRCTDNFGMDHLYSKLAELRFTYGNSLKWGKMGWKNETENLLEMKVPEEVELRHTIIHPVWIDTLFQMFALVNFGKNGEQMIPVSIRKIAILQNQELIKWAYVKVQSADNSNIVLNGYLLDERGSVVIKCEGMQVSQVGTENVVNPMEHMVQMIWKNVEDIESTKKDGIILFSDATGKMVKEMEKWNVPVFSVQKSKEIIDDIHIGKSGKCFPKDLSKFGHIIYSWSLDSTLCDEMDGITMTNEVSDACILLLETIKMIQGLEKPLAVHIIVNGVHALMNKANITSKQALTGVLGLSITGMMRTITWEITQQQYRVIDVDITKPSNLDLLKKVTMEIPDVSAEYAIVNGSLLSCHFEGVPKSVEHYIKSVELKSHSGLKLVNVNHDNENADLEIEHCNMTDKPQSNTELGVKLQKVFFRNGRDIQSDGIGRSTMMCIDSIGTTTYGKDVAIFHPLQVTTNSVSVPKSNCVPLSSFPTEMPCLSFWVTAWSVAQHLRISSKWEVLGSKTDDPASMALKAICEMITGSKGCGYKNAKSLLFCIEETNEIGKLLENVATITENASVYVIAKSSQVSKEVQLLHSHLLKKFRSSKVLSLDSLYTTPLSTTLEKFKSWLDKQSFKKLQNVLNSYVKTISQTTESFNLQDIQESRKPEKDSVISLSNEEVSSLKLKVTPNTLFRRDASYLIFGGSKGLGWETVKHMASNGAGRIGIVSRSGITSADWKILHDLENKFRCGFKDLRADVTNAMQIQEALKIFTLITPALPLKGIFFGAVYLQDCSMMNMTSEIFRRVLAPKVAGAWNLLKLSKSFELDFFVLHSSVISMIGNFGQTNYAAGNAFLDGIAYYRKMFYGEGQSVNWGALHLGILQENAVAQRKLAARGMLSLKKEDILECFTHMLFHNPCVAGYSKFNFPKLSKEIWMLPKAGQNLYKWVLQNKSHYVKKPTNTSNTDDLTKSGNTVTYVRRLVQTLTMAEEDQVPLDTTLDELGVDSQQLTIFLSTLVKDHGKIPTLNVLDLPSMSISDIAARLPGGNNLGADEKKQIQEKTVIEKHDKAPQELFNPRLVSESEEDSSAETKSQSTDLDYTDTASTGSSSEGATDTTSTSTSSDGAATFKDDMLKQMNNQTICTQDLKHGKYFKAEAERTKHLKLTGKKDSYMLEIKSRGLEPKCIHVKDISNISLQTKYDATGNDVHEMTVIWNNGTSQITSVHSNDLQLLTEWKDSILSLKQCTNHRQDITFSEAKSCAVM